MRFQKSLLFTAFLADYFLPITAILPEKGRNHLRNYAGNTEAVSFQNEVEEEVLGLWKRVLQFSVPTVAPTTIAPSPAPTTSAPVVPQAEVCTLEVSSGRRTN